MDEDRRNDRSATALAPLALHEAQRRRQGVRAAMGTLESAVAAPSTDREQAWTAGVVQQLLHLQETFARHISVTEERDGLFDEILFEAPRLARQIDVLRADHDKIAVAIADTVALATRADADGRSAEISERSIDLLTRLSRHRHAGASLVYEAYTVDIDAAD